MKVKPIIAFETELANQETVRVDSATSLELEF